MAPETIIITASVAMSNDLTKRCADAGIPVVMFNRGQDGVGIGCAKIGMPQGQPYIFRRRDSKKDSLAKLFRRELKDLHKKHRKGILDEANPVDLRENFDFAGDVYLGLRGPCTSKHHFLRYFPSCGREVATAKSEWSNWTSSRWLSKSRGPTGA